MCAPAGTCDAQPPDARFLIRERALRAFVLTRESRRLADDLLQRVDGFDGAACGVHQADVVEHDRFAWCCTPA